MTPETALINEYLAKHGACRFEQGATSGIHGIASFMAEYGYEVAGARKAASRFVVAKASGNVCPCQG
ncbi:hypothetical protein C981_00881 [Brucella abortus 78/32]|nr:hypothetical protein C981_00881 [Brucella abortus 78/32]